MNQLKVNLSVINDISLFIQAVTSVQSKIVLKSDRYVVDAKSIMGVYSLNLSEPVIAEIDADEFPKFFLEKIAHMIVE